MPATSLPAPEDAMDDAALVDTLARMIVDEIGGRLQNRDDDDTPELSDATRVMEVPSGLMRGVRFAFADGRIAYVTILIEHA